MPLCSDIHKVLMIGSGPIVIGQAAEFDYAGAQACRVLRDAGLEIVLVNSNPATIMTDQALADHIYLEPLTAATLERVIEKERPDSLLAGLGGQTALNLGMELAESGFLDRMGVRLLGINRDAIHRAEDRAAFRAAMRKLHQPVIPSEIATTLEEALAAARDIGYPVIIRPAFTLGGGGGGVARNEEELRVIAANGLLLSPITQILVEKYIYGWKEIEFEVMRDHAGNVIAVCSMENVDPVGVHTGDSVVVAPALTLSDKEYQMLRSASLDIITELGIEGGCNCQFALSPDSFDYTVIEVNPRVSRSSALASKATGYPIAKVATKIALGYTLDEIRNDVTGKTCACFEPALDYVVLKMPKWPFDKFVAAPRTIGTQMKATGEVMAIGQNFESALLKAVQGNEIKCDTLNHPLIEDDPHCEEELDRLDDLRLFRVFTCLKRGVSLEKIHNITKIDRFFLAKLQRLARFELAIAGDNPPENWYAQGKRWGYTDAALARLSGKPLPEERLHAVYKMVDTCSAEFRAQTPYFYGVMGGRECEAREVKREREGNGRQTVLVLGSGPIRIGQGIEFDYSSVHCVWTLKELGYEVAIINNNPETVSTDFDTADRLYFEPLTPESVADVIRAENPVGVVVAFGGQTAIALTSFLSKSGIPILGTSAEGIDTAEDRERFDELLGRYGFRRPEGHSALTAEEALAAARDLGYPVLLRPSYVIGGQNMIIAHDDEDVRKYMGIILSQKIENPVLIDRYLKGPELEVDCISDGTDVLIPGIMEHIERAGVHSGDSIAVYPPYHLSDKLRETIVRCSTDLALSLGTKGLVNIQYLVYEGELYVIEVNPRASRTIPYISKVTGVPMVDIATRVMTGTPLRALGYGTGLYRRPPYFAVKVPVFSFEKLSEVNSILGPEMKSTGEVLGIASSLDEAIYQGLVAAGYQLRAPGEGEEVGVFLSVDDHDYPDLLTTAKRLLDLGMTLYATHGTARVIARLGAPVRDVGHIDTNFSDITALMEAGKISYVIYTGAMYDSTLSDYIRLHRRAVQLSIASFTSLDTANALARVIARRYTERTTELVDICALRRARARLRFSKMESAGDDYILFDNWEGKITFPEPLALAACDRGTGVGGSGIALLEPSEVADARMRVYRASGERASESGNCARLAAKLLYESGRVPRREMTIEAREGILTATLFTEEDSVTSVTTKIAPPNFSPAALGAALPGDRILARPFPVGEGSIALTCLSLGEGHAVFFDDHPDERSLAQVGQALASSGIFAVGASPTVSVARVVDRTTLRLRSYARGRGEALSSGAGACAAVAAAVALGYLEKDTDITVKVPGGDLIVSCGEDGISLTGDAALVFEGELAY